MWVEDGEGVCVGCEGVWSELLIIVCSNSNQPINQFPADDSKIDPGLVAIVTRQLLAL